MPLCGSGGGSGGEDGRTNRGQKVLGLPLTHVHTHTHTNIYASIHMHTQAYRTHRSLAMAPLMESGVLAYSPMIHRVARQTSSFLIAKKLSSSFSSMSARRSGSFSKASRTNRITSIAADLPLLLPLGADAPVPPAVLSASSSQRNSIRWGTITAARSANLTPNSCSARTSSCRYSAFFSNSSVLCRQRANQRERRPGGEEGGSGLMQEIEMLAKDREV